MIQIYQNLSSDKYTQLDEALNLVIQQRERITMEIRKMEELIDELDNMHDSILEKMAEELEKD